MLSQVSTSFYATFFVISMSVCRKTYKELFHDSEEECAGCSTKGHNAFLGKLCAGTYLSFELVFYYKL